MDDLSEVWDEILPTPAPKLEPAAAPPEAEDDPFAEDRAAADAVIAQIGGLTPEHFRVATKSFQEVADRELEQFFQVYAEVVPSLIETMARNIITTFFHTAAALRKEALGLLSERIDELKRRAPGELRRQLDPEANPPEPRAFFRDWNWPHREGFRADYIDPDRFVSSNNGIARIFDQFQTWAFKTEGAIGLVWMEEVSRIFLAFGFSDLASRATIPPQPSIVLEAMNAYAQALRALRLCLLAREEAEAHQTLADVTRRWASLRSPLPELPTRSVEGEEPSR